MNLVKIDNLGCFVTSFKTDEVAVVLQTASKMCDDVPQEDTSPTCCTYSRGAPKKTGLSSTSALLRNTHQAKPIDCLCMFCSFRRFPAQAKVMGSVVDGRDKMSRIVSVMGRWTSPVTSIRWSSHESCGTGPWFRTK